MLYYKVKTPNMLFRFAGYMQTIKGELFTPSEVKRYSAPDAHGCKMLPDWLEPINVSQRKTHWAFGARFADE